MATRQERIETLQEWDGAATCAAFIATGRSRLLAMVLVAGEFEQVVNVGLTPQEVDVLKISAKTSRFCNALNMNLNDRTTLLLYVDLMFLFRNKVAHGNDFDVCDGALLDLKFARRGWTAATFPGLTIVPSFAAIASKNDRQNACLTIFKEADIMVRGFLPVPSRDYAGAFAAR